MAETMTLSEQNAIEKQILEADARNQLEQFSTVEGTSRDDVMASEQAQEAARMGFGTAPVKATNDANRYQKLYHAFDDREVSLPRYMVGQRLTERFKQGDEEVNPEFWGKQVWLMQADPRRRPSVERTFQCRLSIRASDEFKAEMAKSGLTPTCRLAPKGGGFDTQFQADEHFRVKHPRRWTSYQRWRTENVQTASADRLQETVAALLQGIATAATGTAAKPAPEKK